MPAELVLDGNVMEMDVGEDGFAWAILTDGTASCLGADPCASYANPPADLPGRKRLSW